MVRPKIDISHTQLVDLCRTYHIRRLSLFGSILGDDFRPDSDVDMLVEFHPEHLPGWDIIRIENEFSRLFGGHKVQMVNPKYLNHRLKEAILSTAVLQYEADGSTN